MTEDADDADDNDGFIREEGEEEDSLFQRKNNFRKLENPSFDLTREMRRASVRAVSRDEARRRENFLPTFQFVFESSKFVPFSRDGYLFFFFFFVFFFFVFFFFVFFLSVSFDSSVEKFDEEAEEEGGAHGVDCRFIRCRRRRFAGRESKLRLEKLF